MVIRETGETYQVEVGSRNTDGLVVITFIIIIQRRRPPLGAMDSERGCIVGNDWSIKIALRVLRYNLKQL